MKWILRYIQGMIERCLTFKREELKLKVMWIGRSKNLTDMLTKPITTEKLELCIASVGL